MWINATDVKAKDVFEHRGVSLTALKDAEAGTEVYGGPRVEIWCERSDTGQVGFIYLGPGFGLEVDRA